MPLAIYTFRTFPMVKDLKKQFAGLFVFSHLKSDIESFSAPTGNLNLTVPFPVDYFDMSSNRFPLIIFGFQMPNFSIFLLVFSSLTFLVPPPRSYAFGDIGGLTPFIKSMQKDFMEVELRGMIYSRSDHDT
ncbi:MAG: hypothetical protein WC686_00490 [Candidatus Shapirobacteria bacterium]|jgi:hypothetical protein